MPFLDQCPTTGSCAGCRAALDLASVHCRRVWYCSTACAEGRPTARERETAVPAPRLYARPQRFYGARRPAELSSCRRSAD